MLSLVEKPFTLHCIKYHHQTNLTYDGEQPPVRREHTSEVLLVVQTSGCSDQQALVSLPRKTTFDTHIRFFSQISMCCVVFRLLMSIVVAL